MADSEPVLPRAETYDELYRAFRWSLPKSYNMAVDVCDRHARRAGKTALIYFDEGGAERRLSFDELKRSANALANALEVHGVGVGDRIAILLPQCPETAICHVAAWKMGAISLPLFTLFGEDALEYRLSNSGAKVVVTNRENLPKIVAIRDRLPDLERVIVTDVKSRGTGIDLAFWPIIEQASTRYRNRKTAADDPCLLIYTSGTTGPPKGALHAHRTMIAHMPSMEFYHQFYPQPGDLFWSPADWAWIGGLMDNLMPAWFHGTPVLAFRARKFDPEEAYGMLATYRVRNAFIPPTALKMMRQVPDARERWDLRLRSMFTGGETMGEDLLHWGFETFGIVISEGYGQTECNLMVGNCPAIMDVYPGSMGRAVPGHTVEIVDDDGQVLPVGETGNIAFRQPDPIAMLGYWRNEQATRDKHVGEWMLSGDLGRKDERGYLWFLGRADDVITSAGYRIGPGEIEECLMKHPAVAIAAAIGVPDPMRTEAVKAVIVPAQGFTPSDALATEIQDFVRARLSAHEYPRLIEFADALPLTATGKIRRTELRQRERQRAQEA
jgi:acetyl-CoA synthetase